MPRSPGALTSRPTNHDSGAGQYSVIVTPLSHLPWLCLLGGLSCDVARLWEGARPPTGAPPLTPAVTAVAAVATPCGASAAISSQDPAAAGRSPAAHASRLRVRPR